MAPVYEFLFLLFPHLIMLLVLAGGDGNGYHQGECPTSFPCGYLGNVSFPFTITERQDCGLIPIHNCDHPLKNKLIQLQKNKGKWFEVIRLSELPRTSIFRDKDLYKLLQSRNCEAFRYNYTLPPTPFPFVSFRIDTNVTLFRCNRTLNVSTPPYTYNYTKCHDYVLYYNPLISLGNASLSALASCTKVQLPIKDVADSEDPFTFVTADIYTDVKITDECASCHYKQRGRCQLDSNQRFCCANAKGITKTKKPWKHKHT